MRVFLRKELQPIAELLKELKALFIACVHGGSLKAYKNQAIGKIREKQGLAPKLPIHFLPSHSLWGESRVMSTPLTRMSRVLRTHFFFLGVLIGGLSTRIPEVKSELSRKIASGIYTPLQQV